MKSKHKIDDKNHSKPFIFLPNLGGQGERGSTSALVSKFLAYFDMTGTLAVLLKVPKDWVFNFCIQTEFILETVYLFHFLQNSPSTHSKS